MGYYDLVFLAKRKVTYPFLS